MLFSGDRKVLLEMFTNAHCYSCVAAYELFRQFRVTNANAARTSFVFYHIAQPGVEDSIYFENRHDSDIRNAYYGSYNAAPLLFVDGLFSGSNTKVWNQYFDGRYSEPSPFTISLKGSATAGSFSIETSITRDGAVSDTDLRLHIILTESVSSYIGKNGVTPQIYAMRKMLTGSSGEPFALGMGESKLISRSVELSPHWDREKLWVTVFIQSATKKTVHQSAMISTTFFPLTTVPAKSAAPEDFFLYQNYPNPFNPSTIIDFSIPKKQFVTLTVFDVLGNEMSLLVKQPLSAGRHSIPFDASLFSSGLYFYRLQADGSVLTRKMQLIR